MSDWEIQHAINFYLGGYWDLEFAARWLGVTEERFKDIVWPKCPNCKGTGRVRVDKLETQEKQ